MKDELRKLFKAKLRTLSENTREGAKLALLDLPLPSDGLILSFVSIHDEISTYALNSYLAKEGRLLLPRIEGDSLGIYKVNSLDDLVAGSFGLLEPLPVQPAIPDLILVPGLAFDLKGHRLGYGKGFYDRLLAKYPDVPSIGIGFTCQQTNSLPSEPHDQLLKSCYMC